MLPALSGTAPERVLVGVEMVEELEMRKRTGEARNSVIERVEVSGR